jgi:HSP20 family protein
MPTIIRRSQPILIETRREIYNSVTWHVRSNVWRPPTDVYESEEYVVVRMEIAGMRDEDLEVVVQDHLLLISGSRSDSTERKAYHQMEIPFGKFSVGVDLPVEVNTENATAEYKDGFLTIQLPKEK